MWLDELAQMLGLKPSEVLERYGALSKDAPLGVLAVTGGTRIVNEQISELVLRSQTAEEAGVSIYDNIYVPAGWAIDVLTAFNQGYTRVTLEKVYVQGQEDPAYTPGGEDWYWKIFPHRD